MPSTGSKGCTDGVCLPLGLNEQQSSEGKEWFERVGLDESVAASEMDWIWILS
jgi:hypothetical protein